MCGHPRWLLGWQCVGGWRRCFEGAWLSDDAPTARGCRWASEHSKVPALLLPPSTMDPQASSRRRLPRCTAPAASLPRYAAAAPALAR